LVVAVLLADASCFGLFRGFGLGREPKRVCERISCQASGLCFGGAGGRVNLRV
jgi:hypothetical protein